MENHGLADIVGIFGAALIITAYFLLQTGRVRPESVWFSVANALGATGIIFSLVYDFNLSAMIIELFWLAISVFGLVRALRLRRK